MTTEQHSRYFHKCSNLSVVLMLLTFAVASFAKMPWVLVCMAILTVVHLLSLYHWWKTWSILVEVTDVTRKQVILCMVSQTLYLMMVLLVSAELVGWLTVSIPMLFGICIVSSLISNEKNLRKQMQELSTELDFTLAKMGWEQLENEVVEEI